MKDTDNLAQEIEGYKIYGLVTEREVELLWNQAIEPGGVLVSDEVKIELDLELTKS